MHCIHVVTLLGLACLLQTAWCRTLSVSLNLSLSHLNELASHEQQNEAKAAEKQPQLSQDMLRSCMRETEISMSQLKLFRLSLLTNYDDAGGKTDYNDDEAIAADTTQFGDMDYVGNPQMQFLDLKRNEPLQCFVRCLYERLDLIKYDVVLEEAFKTQVQDIMRREKPEIKECMDLDSKNRCEAAYKLHLCYNHLKTLEAEQRIREVLEHGGGDVDGIVRNNDADADGNAAENENGFVNGLKHSEENKIEQN